VLRVGALYQGTTLELAEKRLFVFDLSSVLVCFYCC
jgi:hypothetical protein